jgi:hypothetical protein
VINVREVILEFKGDDGWDDMNAIIPLCIAYGNISYSSNYILVQFQKLKRGRDYSSPDAINT